MIFLCTISYEVIILDICKKFGDNVKKYRISQNISQEKLAELTKLHRTYISDVERGLRSISLKNIQLLADSLNIDIYKLFIFNEEVK